MIKSQIVHTKSLPKKSDFHRSTIFFYDKKVARHKYINSWLGQFDYKIALNAGESLKSIESYSNVLKQIQKMSETNNLGGSELTFVALGGGSVGDFVGFLAATYQRGKKLVSIPTTWLSAVDSAHGGKNGINLNQVKNQIGTYYPADKIYICEKILKGLPPESLNDSYAEALKMGIISQPKLFLNLRMTNSSMLKNLPALISAKNSVVVKDPYEKKGLRKILNLGHTVGHVFEVMHAIPHGQAVLLGMLFALRFSLKKKYLKWDNFLVITEQLFEVQTNITYQQALHMPMTNVVKILNQDKKIISDVNIDFVFVKGLGKVFLKKITTAEIIKELLRQQQEL
jgi:3-dehydroquinate synthase